MHGLSLVPSGGSFGKRKTSTRQAGKRLRQRPVYGLTNCAIVGLYTSTMLVGTKDIKSALELLESMYDDCSNLGSVDPENVPFMGKVAFALGLLYLQIGDTISARQWFKNVEQDEVLRDLGISVCSIADLDWDTAESTLNKIDVSDTASSIPIAVKNNLAVTEIYKGRLNNVSSFFPFFFII